MKRLPAPLLFFGLVVLYALFGRLVFEVAAELMPRRVAAGAVGAFWILGFVLLVGAVVGGSTSGWVLLRYWIATMGALAIAVAPVALFSSPMLALIGVPAAIAFANFWLRTRD